MYRLLALVSLTWLASAALCDPFPTGRNNLNTEILDAFCKNAILDAARPEDEFGGWSQIPQFAAGPQPLALETPAGAVGPAFEGFEAVQAHDQTPRTRNPNEADRARVRRYASNYLALVYGNERRDTVYAEDRDPLALLRNPLVESAAAKSEMRIPSPVQQRAQTIVADYMNEAGVLQAQVEMAIGKLGKKNYSPLWANRLVSAYVAMDQERTFARDSRAEMGHLTRLQRNSSVAYINLHDAQKSLGASQDRLLTWIRRLLFNLVAFNLEEGSTFSGLGMWEADLQSETDSVEELVKRRQLDPNVFALLNARDNAFVRAQEELMALILLPEKLPMSVESRLVLKALVDVVQDLAFETEGKATKPRVGSAPFDEKAEWGIASTADEASFVRRHLGQEVKFDGAAYRTKLAGTFAEVLRPLVGAPKMAQQLRFFGEKLGLALYDLRDWEIKVQRAREEYASTMNAATAAASSINRVTRPYGSQALETDSVQMDAWIQDLSGFPDLREMGMRLIALRGGFSDPVRGQFVTLPADMDVRRLLRRIPATRKDQLIAAQLFTSDRVQNACLFAQIFYLRKENDHLRQIVGARTWNNIADATEAGSRAAWQKSIQNTQGIMGDSSVTVAAMEAAQKNIEKERQKSEQPAPITERISEQPLPHPSQLVPALLAVWDESVLGPKPDPRIALRPDRNPTPSAGPKLGPAADANGQSPKVDPEADGVQPAATVKQPPEVQPVPLEAAEDSFTLLSAVLQRLDAQAWKVFQANIAAQDRLYEALTKNVPDDQIESHLADSWAEYYKELQDDYENEAKKVREVFWRVRRAVQNAFKDRASTYEISGMLGGESHVRPVLPQLDGFAWSPRPPRNTSAAKDSEEEIEEEKENVSRSSERMPLFIVPTVESKQLEKQVLASDATLIREVAPYEALTWLLLKTRSTTQQFFLSELLFYVVQQSYGLSRSEITEPNLSFLPTISDGKKRTLLWGGLLAGAIVANQVAGYVAERWIWPEKPAAVEGAPMEEDETRALPRERRIAPQVEINTQSDPGQED